MGPVGAEPLRSWFREVQRRDRRSCINQLCRCVEVGDTPTLDPQVAVRAEERAREVPKTMCGPVDGPIDATVTGGERRPTT